ncbi:hypothetical protein ACO0SA_002379 [Hanseniaspora valbyensis]
MIEEENITSEEVTNQCNTPADTSFKEEQNVLSNKNDVSMVELPNISEAKGKKKSPGKSKNLKSKKSQKKSSSSKTKKSSKSKKSSSKKNKHSSSDSDSENGNANGTADDNLTSSTSTSTGTDDDSDSSGETSSSESSSITSSSTESSSGKKRSSKRSKIPLQQHPLYIRSFDDVNGTFIDHRPSMTEPVLMNKKKSMLKKRRERKKKAKLEKEKEQQEKINKQDESNILPSRNPPLETLHEEPEHDDAFKKIDSKRNKLIEDLQTHLNKEHKNKRGLNSDNKLPNSVKTVSNYGSIATRDSESKGKEKYKGISHYSKGNIDLTNLGSKPPSSNSDSSDASSLGDVCLPITSDSEYYISDLNSDEENNKSVESVDSQKKSKRNYKSGKDVTGSDIDSELNSKGFDGKRYEKEMLQSISDLNKKADIYNNKEEDEKHNFQKSFSSTNSNKNKRRKRQTVKKEWPDISVLEEFSKEETEKLKRQAISNNKNMRKYMVPDFYYDNMDINDVHADDDGVDPTDSIIEPNFSPSPRTAPSPNTEDAESAASSSIQGFQPTIGFKNPLVSNVDVPELGNAKINETQLLKNKNLRNTRFQAWKLKNKAQKKLANTVGTTDKSGASDKGDLPRLSKMNSDSTTNITKKNTNLNENPNFLIGDSSIIQYPPQIISNNPEHFRFAYFRDDMESTVHSPTISGLLQPGQLFRDLFVGEHYKKNVDYDESDFDSEGNLKFDEDNNYVAPFWLDVLNPTEEEMKVISKAFGIHPLTAEDIFLGEAREKVELFKDYYLVCFRSFDIVAERTNRDNKSERSGKSRRSSFSNASTMESNKRHGRHSNNNPTVVGNLKNKVFKFFGRDGIKSIPNTSSQLSTKSSAHFSTNMKSSNANSRQSQMSKQQKEKELEEYKRKSGSRHKPRSGELEPLNVYILVFRTGVLTFHFAPTPHPINVRRRARLIRDYMDVSSDWIAYALIDDITDAFAPIIEIIEDEVYDIEEAILKMHSPNLHNSDDDSDLESDGSDFETDYEEKVQTSQNKLNSRTRSLSTVRPMSSTFAEQQPANNVTFKGNYKNNSENSSLFSQGTSFSAKSTMSNSTSSSDTTSMDSNIILWKRKGDMLRRIAECRKRVMSVSRLLGSKADVIKSFAKRCNEDWEVAPRSDIGMYLGDIQDHIVTMVSSLNHFEKLLSRSHSNYLAQINIDMTKVNNDMNDVLSKITILGTAVLPLNVITGLWGMNCVVPGQAYNNLGWFFGIVGFMTIFAGWSVWFTKKKLNF